MDASRASSTIRFAAWLLLGSLVMATSASAATITVDTLVDENDGVGTNDISLRDAINEANSNGQDDTIDFGVTGTMTLTADLPTITSNVTIDGPGAASLSIDGDGQYRVFTVTGSGSVVAIRELKVANAYAKGGNGAALALGGGGGGACGMGPGLFVDDGVVLLDSVDFEDNQAIGGAGGGSAASGFGGGGGGGIAGNGVNSTGGSGGFLGGSPGGQGKPGGNGGAGAGAGGGMYHSGDGGDGGFGAGGGGGAYGDDFSSTGLGGTGGDGGFGGGGGGAGRNDTTPGSPTGGAGGTFAGDGGIGSTSSQGFGGGGAGLGGAIFVRTGVLEMIDCNFHRNSATGGAAGGSGATGGDGKGGAVFVNSGASVLETGTAFGTGGDANSASDDAATSGDNDDVYGTISTIPVVQSMTRQNANPSNASQVTYFVTFSEAVTGVNAADFTVIASGVTGASVDASIVDVGSGAIYAVTINTGSGSGSVQLQLVDDDSIANGSSVKLGGTGSGNGDFTANDTYAIDRGTPRALTSGAITRNDANPTKASQVAFVVAFDEAVTGVDTTDFTIDAAGLTGASIASVTNQGGGNFLVTVNTGTGAGTLSIDLIDDDSILDAAQNALGGAGSGNGAITNGEAYTVDKVRPTVTVAPSTTGPTNADTLTFTVTFDEDVSDFDDTDDVSVEHDGTAHKGLAISRRSDAAYDVTLSGITGDGELVLYAKANAASDSVGNKNTISTASDAVTIDNTAPTVASFQAPEGLNEMNQLVFTIAFSEAVTGFTAEDVAINHDGTAHDSIAIEADSATTYRVIVAGVTGTGTASVTLAADAVTDTAGNGNAVTTSDNVTLDDDTDSSESGPGGPLCGAAATPLLGLTAMCLIGWRHRRRRSMLND